MSKQAYMRVENIVKKFGPFTALNGVDLEVHAVRFVRHERIVGAHDLERTTLPRVPLLDGLHAVERAMPPSTALEANHDRHRNSMLP